MIHLLLQNYTLLFADDTNFSPSHNNHYEHEKIANTDIKHYFESNIMTISNKIFHSIGLYLFLVPMKKHLQYFLLALKSKQSEPYRSLK